MARVILSRRLGSWDEFFQLRKKAGVPDDFLEDRENEPPQKRKRF